MPNRIKKPVAQYAQRPPKMKLAIRSTPWGCQLKDSSVIPAQTMNWNAFIGRL